MMINRNQKHKTRCSNNKNGYASIKIKMQPKSLLIDVPLEWEVNKVKCLLVKMIPLIEFDMFYFQHDNQYVDPASTIEQLLVNDNDQYCELETYYTLTFKKHSKPTSQLNKVHNQKMKIFYQQLQQSPFEPILDNNYFNNKMNFHLQNIKFYQNKINQGIQNSNKKIHFFQQMNIQQKMKFLNDNKRAIQQQRKAIEEQRRILDNFNANQNQIRNANNQQVNNGNGNGINAGLFDNQGGNGGNWCMIIFIRLIQIMTVFTLLRILYQNSSIEIFIVLTFVVLFYYLIGYFQTNNQQGHALQEDLNKEQINKNQSANESKIKLSMFTKLILEIFLNVTQKLLLITQVVISYILSLFPNWTIQYHKQMFRNIYRRIQQKLNKIKDLLKNNQQLATQIQQKIQLNDQDEQLETNQEKMHIQ